MNRFMTILAYYQSFPSAFPHQEYPIGIAFQVLEFLYLVDFEISTVFSAQFTGMPFHTLF